MSSILSILSIVAFMYTIIVAIFFIFDKSIRTSEGILFILAELVVIEVIVGFWWCILFLR